MLYDPFARGPHPVGVRTLEVEGARARRLPTELWYPATDAARGADLDPQRQDRYRLVAGFRSQLQAAVRDAAPRPGSFPLVVFSHGFAGHRRQSSFLCTHLASRGYVVASADHAGSTVLDLVNAMADRSRRRAQPIRALTELAADRPADAIAVIDHVFDDPAVAIDRARVAVAGHSFGGWTALATAGSDERVAVVVALAPAGVEGSRGADLLGEVADYDWQRVVPVLVVAGRRDSIVPATGMRGLVARLRAPTTLCVVDDTDHMHFCDDAERAHEVFRSFPQVQEFVPTDAPLPPFSELCAATVVYDVVRGLGAAHLEAFLGQSDDAQSFLAGDLPRVLAARGASVTVARGGA